MFRILSRRSVGCLWQPKQQQLQQIRTTLSVASSSDYVRQLEIIRKIRDTVQVQDALDLPQICVIGDQSAGKSSFLARLTGVAFPTAANTCTKAATVVTCVFDQDADEPLYEIEHVDERGTYIPVDSTANAIQERQDILLANLSLDHRAGMMGTFSGIISDRSINLRVTSKDVIDIILVDLPGIQHAGLAKDAINALIEANIKKPETLIVIVSEAKQDFELTKAIETAKQYDPKQERTIRILSKFDNFDTHETRDRAVSIIKEGLLPMSSNNNNWAGSSLGPHAVISNAPDGSLRMDEGAHAEETKELVEVYGLPPSRAGIESLKTRLQPLFASLVKKNMPKLKKIVSDKLVKAEKSLDAIGRSNISSDDMVFKCHRSLKENLAVFEQALTNDAIFPLKEAILETKGAITFEFATKHFKPNSFQCILFQGSDVFDRAIQELRQLWEPAVSRYIEEAKFCALKSMDVLKVDGQTRDFAPLISAIVSDYQAHMQKEVFPKFEQACRQCLHESSFFGTTNHYFDAKYVADDLCPPSFIHAMRKNLAALWNDPERTPRFETSGGYRKLNLALVQSCLEEAAQEAAKEIVHEDLVRTQKQRLFAAVKAHFDVEKKTFADNILKKTKDILVSGHKRWIEQELSLRSENIARAAVEDPHIQNLRTELQGQVERLSECMLLLHDVPLSPNQARGPGIRPDQAHNEPKRLDHDEIMQIFKRF